MTKGNTRTTFPGKDATHKIINSTNDTSEPWKTFSGDGCNLYSQRLDLAKKLEVLSWLGGITKEWYGNRNLIIDSVVDSVMKSIQNVVIMPAGNVLQFKGLDRDEAGNLYSTVDY